MNSQLYVDYFSNVSQIGYQSMCGYSRIGCIRVRRISFLPPLSQIFANVPAFPDITPEIIQHDPVSSTPPPYSHSRWHTYHWQLKLETLTSPCTREEALTAYGTETSQNLVPVPKTALTDEEDRASNAQEEARQKSKEALEEVKWLSDDDPTVNGTSSQRFSTTETNVDINSGMTTQYAQPAHCTKSSEASPAAACDHDASTQE
ncbi:hypothetical protein Tco_1120627 [Tanacetum coccineum]